MPARYRWTGYSKLFPRRRCRHKLFDIRSQLLQAVIGVLNWETLGYPCKPPEHVCVGTGYSDDQWQMVEKLERLVDYFLRPGPITASSLGCSGEKFNMLLRAAQELPNIGIVDLDELVTNLTSNFDFYSKPSRSEQPAHNTSDLHGGGIQLIAIFLCPCHLNAKYICQPRLLSRL